MPQTNQGKRPVSLFKLVLLVVFLTLFSGCTDYYEKQLPSDGRLTSGEVAKIVSKLANSDKEIFQRWSERMLRKEQYGGEPTAPTVKLALLNQIEFEQKQQQAEKEISEKRIAQEKLKSQKDKIQRDKQEEYERIASQRSMVDAEIRKYFSAQALSYEFRPLFNQRGEEFARQWVFKLKLTNASSKSIIGAAGWANISDVFGNTMGSYPMKIEPQVSAGKSIEYFVTMDHNRKNPQHIAMTEASTFMVNWFFESVAFSDGSILDKKSIAIDKVDIKKSPPINSSMM